MLQTTSPARSSWWTVAARSFSSFAQLSRRPLMIKAQPTVKVTESVYAARPWLNHYNYWVPAHMNYPRRPLHEILRITAAEVPDRPATAFLGAHLTYSQIKEQADKFATALVRLGIRQGDRVGIMLPNCPQYVVATFGVL